MKTQIYNRDDWVTAYHEAGHAVMAMTTGFDVFQISVGETEVDGKKSLGSTSYSITTSKNTLIDGVDFPLLKRKGIVLLGGTVSEKTFFGDWGDASALDDRIHFYEKLGDYTRVERDELYALTVNLFQRKEIQHQVRKLAWVLIHHNYHLDNFEVCLILSSLNRKWRVNKMLIGLRHVIKKIAS